MLSIVVLSSILALSLAQQLRVGGEKTGYYFFTEAKSGSCTGKLSELKDWKCDGARTCSKSGLCQGDADHPADGVRAKKGPNFYFDEKPTGSRCLTDFMCDGARTCSDFNWCQGEDKHPRKGPTYHFDESPKNSRCDSDWDCDGERTCSEWHWCQGEANNKKGPNYKFDETKKGHKCKNSWECNASRTCSEFGWCQN